MTPTSREMTDLGIAAAAYALDVDPAVVRAVAEVESSGSGFLDDGRPKILFEGHWFSRLTSGRFDASHPTISYPKWTKAHSLGGARESERLDAARTLNESAALKSASWGAFQILGVNHRAAGFSSVEAFVEAMKESADRHLLAFVEFIKSKGLVRHLKAREWASFARGYNGPAFAANKYDVKHAEAFARHSATSPPAA